MRKFLSVLLAVLTALSGASAAFAQEEEMQTDEIIGVIGEQWTEISADEIEALADEYTGDGSAGTLQDQVYTHASGLRFVIPENWTLYSDIPATTVMLRGETDDTGFSPSISVLMVEEEMQELLQLNEDNVDEYYGKTLKGYQRLLFDRFDYRTSTACEIGILYGETEESMLIQYQFFFMENGCTYLITMTSRADEEAYLNTLDTYDLFLADFEPAQG